MRRHWRDRKRREAESIEAGDGAHSDLPLPVTHQNGYGAPETGSDRDDARRLAVQRCLELLPAADRELVEAYYECDDDDCREALANRMGITVNALYIRISRARSKLRGCAKRQRGVEFSE